MKAFIISLVAAIGTAVAATATSGCLLAWIDEPEMPKAMLER